MKIISFQSVLLCSAIILTLIACRTTGDKGASPEMQNTIIGKWEGDLETMMELHPELADNPMAEMMNTLVASLEFEFTEDSMIVSAMGESHSVSYTVLSSDQNIIKIQAADGDHVGETTVIEFIPGNRIKISPEHGDEAPLVLRRVN